MNDERFRTVSPYYILLKLRSKLILLLLPFIRDIFEQRLRFTSPDLIYYGIVAVIVAVQWLTFRYRITEGEIAVRKGLIFVRESRLPRDKICAAAVGGGLILNLFGARSLTLTAVCTRKYPFPVLYLPRRRALALIPSAERRLPPVAPWRLALTSLLTSNALFGLFIIVPAFNTLGRILGDELEERILSGLTVSEQKFLPYLPPLWRSLALIFIIGFTVSFLNLLITNARSRVSLCGETAIIERGLIFHSVTSVDTAKAAALTIYATGAMRLLKLYSLRADCFFRKRGNNTLLLISAAQYAQICGFLRELTGGRIPERDAPEITVAKVAKGRLLIRPLIVIALIIALTAVLSIILPNFSYLITALAIYPLIRAGACLAGVKMKQRYDAVSVQRRRTRCLRGLSTSESFIGTMQIPITEERLSSPLTRVSYRTIVVRLPGTHPTRLRYMDADTIDFRTA